MKISRFFLDGYKNIDEVEIPLDKVTCLVSPNSFGKSNVLRGFFFGIVFMLQLTNKEAFLSPENDYIPINRNQHKSLFVFEIDFSFNEGKKLGQYRYSLRWGIPQKSRTKVSEEILKIKSDTDAKFTTVLDRNEDKAAYKSSETGRCDHPILIGDSELVINKLLAFDDLYFRDFVRELNEIKYYIDRHLDPNENFQYLPFKVKSTDVFDMGTETNVPKILFNLKKKQPGRFNLIMDAYKQLFPSISDIWVQEVDLSRQFNEAKKNAGGLLEINDRHYVLYVQDKNLSKGISFDMMSDGARRILLLLTFLTVAEMQKYPVVAIEEPENSINPGLLKKYLATLNLFTDEMSILICSHSPNLVNYVDFNTLMLGVPSGDGLAQFRLLKKAGVKKLMTEASEEGIQAGDYVFDLMSGSSEDAAHLKSFLE